MEEILRFVSEWRNKPMSNSPRKDLEDSDRMWERIFREQIELRAIQDTLIFRVNHGGGSEPILSDYADRGEEQKEIFNQAHRLWTDQSDPNKLRFDNHWVSFTKNPEIIRSAYFASKGMRGLVVIAKVKEAIDISEIPAIGFQSEEEEVVAPLELSQVIEILPFVDFERKYCEN